MSKRTLQYGFQQFVGLSPKAYFTQQRIKSVHQALIDAPRGHRVTDVIMQHGINSPGHFAAQYKEVYGVTPCKHYIQTANILLVTDWPTYCSEPTVVSAPFIQPQYDTPRSTPAFFLQKHTRVGPAALHPTG